MAAAPVEVQHNGKSGNDFIVRIELASAANDDVRRIIAKWVGRACLAVEPYVAGTYGPWRIIWDDQNVSCDESDVQDGIPLRMYVLVHHAASIHLPHSADGLLILDSIPLIHKIESDTLAQALSTTARTADMPHLVKVGVSAVTPSVMAKYWWYVLNGEDGYMVKPMLFADFEYNIRETSFNFGWDSYPPTDNESGDIHWPWRMDG
jgi:hypothetical protein